MNSDQTGARKKKLSPAVILAAAALLLGIGLSVRTLGLPHEEQTAEPAPASEAVVTVSAAPELPAETAAQDSPEQAAIGGQEESSEEQLEAERAAAYQEAEALLTAGDSQAAWKAFRALEDYRDSQERADAIYESVTGPEALAAASVGDTILLGTYEQDGSIANGPEWIEWLVLDREEDRILVISKYGLSSQAFNAVNSSVTWEHCSLRDFMNRRFLNDAFSEQEQARILTVPVRAEQNPFFDTDSGADTQDRLFLLSIEEADIYFSSDMARRCIPTPNTAAQGACVSTTYDVDGQGTCWWWLRQPGRRNNLAACIDEDGAIHPSGYDNDLDDVAMRPAMWINIG